MRCRVAADAAWRPLASYERFLTGPDMGVHLHPNPYRIKCIGATMEYAFTQDVPIGADFYRRITDALGPDAPAGLVLHVAVERPEGGLRYIDLWESKAECDRFV